MGGKQDLRFAIAALIAGVAWGYLRHRRDGRAPIFALLQGIEWFVSYGGAAALIEGARRLLEEGPDEDSESTLISHFRQVVTERTGAEG